VGASNKMALAAVELAATRPGEMSPLGVHGPGGVGKTHLAIALGMAAIAQAAYDGDRGVLDRPLLFPY
jgi:chromosomal replication initiation ATPase DnaA